MKNISIVLLNLSTLLITAPLYGMNREKNVPSMSWADRKDAERQPTSYRDAATGSHQEYRSSRTVAAAYPERYSDNPNRPRKLWQPNRSQQQQAQELSQTQEDSTSPKPQRAITLLTQSSAPAATLSEQANSKVDEQDAVTVDNKILQRLALIADMLPAVLKKQAQQEVTIAALKKELTTQAQVHSDELQTANLHYQQQRSMWDNEHKKALQALHEEFNRQMLSKQEELSKRVVELTEKMSALQAEHAKALEAISQNTGSLNYQLYVIASAMGLVQPIPPAEQAPEQKVQKEQVDN